MPDIRYAEWGAAECRAIARSLVPLGRDAARAALERALGARVPGSQVLPINAARTGIGLLLEELTGGRRGRVVVPAYVCPSVVRAVEASGATPEPVAVDAALDLDPAALAATLETLGSEVTAVIAAHMYGAPAAITAIEAICRRHGVPLIDDAAQVAGIAVDGRALGTFGDAGLVSFAQSKTIVTGVRGSGGAILVRDTELARRLRARVAALPAPRRRGSACLHFVAAWLSGRHVRAAYDRIERVLSRARRSAGDTEDWFRPARISALEARIACAQLRSLERRIAARQRVADAFARHLASLPAIAFPQYRPGCYLTRIMVLLPADCERDRIRARLRELGVGTRAGYDVTPLTRWSGAIDTALADRLLELPSHGRMRDRDVARVTEALAQALAGGRGAPRAPRLATAPSG